MNKIENLGKIGFWLTLVIIIGGAIFQLLYQYSLWIANWSWISFHSPLHPKDLYSSPARDFESIVSLTRGLLNITSMTLVLLVFRNLWIGNAFSRKVVNLLILLAALCCMGIFFAEVEVQTSQISQNSDGENFTFSFGISDLRYMVVGILVFSCARILNLAIEQKRQLEGFV